MSDAIAAVRDAASLILIRHDRPRPQVLMGQRGSSAVFMPDKFVFPGGGLDPCDIAYARIAAPEASPDLRLAGETVAEVASALPYSAVRELWEETGLVLGAPDPAASEAAGCAPGPWGRFLAMGLRPKVEALRFFFRAVTPPGQPRRFDARFFLADAVEVADDPADFSKADAELSLLQWIDLDAARCLPLPFITMVVLSEIEAMIEGPEAIRGVPFFKHDEEGSHFRMIA
jgi:8-oxo-dGTP pyrophosphatase MutT (NUDIX family)